jgi:hypothetical protein
VSYPVAPPLPVGLRKSSGIPANATRGKLAFVVGFVLSNRDFANRALGTRVQLTAHCGGCASTLIAEYQVTRSAMHLAPGVRAPQKGHELNPDARKQGTPVE